MEPTFQWGPFFVFAIVNSVTPGPNVVMLTSSGSAWGYKKTLPHLMGVSLGFPIMFLVIQFGADKAFQMLPWLFPVLTFLSLVYILWLSFRIFMMGFIGELKMKKSERPMTFFEIILFQWVNGKAWQIVLMAATLYPSPDAQTKFLGALSFVIVLFVCGSGWVEIGRRIARYLENSTTRKVYYAVLALSLALSTIPTGISQLRSQIHLFGN